MEEGQLGQAARQARLARLTGCAEWHARMHACTHARITPNGSAANGQRSTGPAGPAISKPSQPNRPARRPAPGQVKPCSPCLRQVTNTAARLGASLGWIARHATRNRVGGPCLSGTLPATLTLLAGWLLTMLRCGRSAELNSQFTRVSEIRRPPARNLIQPRILPPAQYKTMQHA